jgi:GTPase SAR1 family protein
MLFKISSSERNVIVIVNVINKCPTKEQQQQQQKKQQQQRKQQQQQLG